MKVTSISNFQPIRLLDPDCCYKFTYLIANSADPDQLVSLQKPTDLDRHCLQRQDISRFSRTRVKKLASKPSKSSLGGGRSLSSMIHITCQSMFDIIIILFSSST